MGVSHRYKYINIYLTKRPNLEKRPFKLIVQTLVPGSLTSSIALSGLQTFSFAHQIMVQYVRIKHSYL